VVQAEVVAAVAGKRVAADKAAGGKAVADRVAEDKVARGRAVREKVAAEKVGLPRDPVGTVSVRLVVRRYPTSRGCHASKPSARTVGRT
jgi:hypothetical protein